MTTDQNPTNNPNIQNLISQLNGLVDEARETNREIDEINREAREKMNDIEMKVDESIKNLEQIFSDLDQAEKEAGDELDKLILQQAEDLASEEEE